MRDRWNGLAEVQRPDVGKKDVRQIDRMLQLVLRTRLTCSGVKMLRAALLTEPASPVCG